MNDDPEPIATPTPESPDVAQARKARESREGAPAHSAAPRSTMVIEDIGKVTPNVGSGQIPEGEDKPKAKQQKIIYVRRLDFAYLDDKEPDDPTRIYRPIYLGGTTVDEWKTKYGVVGPVPEDEPDLGDPELVKPSAA